MKAIIETGGKQFLISKDDEIFVEKLNIEDGKKVVFDKILMLDNVYGNPYVEGAKVHGEVIKSGKQKKIIVYHFRAKKNFSKKQGHRQPYTKVKITKIEG